MKLFRSPPGDVAVLLITFFLTVFVDLVTGIEVGIALAAFLFVYPSSPAATSEAPHLAEILPGKPNKAH